MKKKYGSIKKEKSNCIYCKKLFQSKSTSTNGNGATTKYCSHKCYTEYRVGKLIPAMANRPNYLRRAGYQYIKVPPEFHAGQVSRGLRAHKYYQEHRYVAEQMIGRPLKRSEAVHHIDFNRLNNKPENLFVLTQSDHKRLETNMAHKYMKEIIKTKERLIKEFPWLIDVQVK